MEEDVWFVERFEWSLLSCHWYGFMEDGTINFCPAEMERLASFFPFFGVCKSSNRAYLFL